MHEITGDAGTKAIVYGNYPDANELQQIFSTLACPAFTGAAVRIMPDHHAGAGCVIGFTAPVDATNPKVVPNVVGVDLGCGVRAIQLPEGPTRDEHFAAFDRHLRENVPSGFAVRNETFRDIELVYGHMDRDTDFDAFRAAVAALAKKVGTDERRVWCSAGSLGGGNHFLELERDDAADTFWLAAHSGSRNFGLQVANYHQNKAKQSHPRGALSWLEGDEAREYLADMRTCQRFAKLNRAVMLYVLSSEFVNRAHTRLSLPSVESVHNYIGDDNVIRKGAVSAKLSERVVIPWNMRDGMIIGVGRGNADWNESAPHGAGRRMGRREAKDTLSVDAYRAAMDGIWSSCVSKATIDEAPDAYKPSTEVEAALADTVEVLSHLRPVYNFKASEEADRGSRK